MLLATINRNPVNYNEAIASDDKLEWEKGIRDEFKSLEDIKVWKFVERPQTMIDGSELNVIDSRWIFKKKTEKDGSTKFKARLVIKGFKDKKTDELRETYYCDQIERWILLLLLKSLLIVPNLFRLLRSNPLPPRYTYANEFSNHQNTWQSPPSE